MKALAIKSSLFSCLKTYNKKTFMSDLMAGIIVGIVALPLAIAFGIASGVTPEKGIITAIVAGLIISIFGGSKVQIGGPTGAFIVIIYGIIQKYGMRRFDHRNTDGWSLPGSLRTAPSRYHHQVHPLPYRGGIYQRYRRNHLHHAD